MRRGIKKRGILPSFGDLALPIVSVAAVGLLVLAGRQFFINGMQSSPEVTSSRAYAEAPALIAEREREAEVVPAPAPATTAQAEPEPEPEPEAEENMLAVAEVITPQPVKASAPAPAPAKVAAKTTTTKAATAKTTTAKKAESVPMNKQWRVQVGAYGSKAAAEDAAKKIRRAGYKAVVYNNPASKHVKVWVEGGPTKFYADRMVEAMKKLGFKSSFAFPPAK